MVRTHVTELLSLDIIGNCNSDSFRKFVDKILVQSRSLEALSVAQNTFDIFLSEIVLLRIPYKLKLSYAKMDSSQQTLDCLIKLLQTELKSIDVVWSAHFEK